jgi:GTP pyrophosphokinase
MGKIKTDLEDIAFPHAFPEEFNEISLELSNQKKWADDRLLEMNEALQLLLKELNIPGETSFRMKREISIYRKLIRQNINLHQVYDLLALRVITDSVANCYALLNGIHHNAQWQYIPSRLRDFITAPKANGYQSLHTTVITKQGYKFEIQIRTPEMDKIAEEGIAAHWRYKEGVSFLENDQRLQWFRDMIDAHRNNPNPKDFLSLVKGELTPNEIYVFTPKGKVINLKAGSTAIDFAFAIHSQVGSHCKSAIVNEQMVPLRTVLNSGDVVEVITDKKCNPTADWLKFTTTARARKKIIAYLQRQENAQALDRGRRLWLKTLRTIKQKHALKIPDNEIENRIVPVLFPDIDHFYREIGSSRKLLDKRLVKKILPEIPGPVIVTASPRSVRNNHSHKLVLVEGYHDIDVSFAKCCNPIKGDDIVGLLFTNRRVPR